MPLWADPYRMLPEALQVPSPDPHPPILLKPAPAPQPDQIPHIASPSVHGLVSVLRVPHTEHRASTLDPLHHSTTHHSTTPPRVSSISTGYLPSIPHPSQLCHQRPLPTPRAYQRVGRWNLLRFPPPHPAALTSGERLPVSHLQIVQLPPALPAVRRQPLLLRVIVLPPVPLPAHPHRMVPRIHPTTYQCLPLEPAPAVQPH